MILSLSLLAVTLFSTTPVDSQAVIRPVTAPASFLSESKQSDTVLQTKRLPLSPQETASKEKFLGKNSDTLSAKSGSDTSKYIPAEEFTWAGARRYLLDGSQPLRVTEIKPVTFYALEGTYLGVLVALHIYQENTFWRQSTSFRVRDNWDESLGANYGGHMVAAYFISYMSTEFLLASGVSTKLAPIYGSLMGLGYQTYVEVLDGYGSNFQFSPYETYFQTLGVVYFLASQYSPFLQNFVPKFNYYPSKWFGGLPKAASLTPIDDYSAWNLWICANIPNLTKGALAPYWPDWLNIAIGYGARNLDDVGEARVVTLSLDYNLIKLLPDGGPTWNWFKQTLNFVKFPSPTLEWRFDRVGWKSQGPAKFYLVYPFTIASVTF